MGSKVPFFFSAEKIRGYSLTRFGQFLFFFISRFWKKKTSCFFFPRKSLQATHSAERRSIYKKRSKQVKNGTFCQILVFFVVFFFPKNLDKILFFFPRKSSHVTHSLDFRGRKKKQPRKKTEFLLTHSIFPKKVQISIFSGEIKKYGTFGAVTKNAHKHLGYNIYTVK